MSYFENLEKLLSDDRQKRYEVIVYLSHHVQNPAIIKPYAWVLKPYERLNDYELRENSYRTHRYRKVAKALQFYQDAKGCACQLFDEVDNPKDFIEMGLLKKLSAEPGPDDSVYGQVCVECLRCGTFYQVYMREYHYIWWEWVKKVTV
ncbi:hypothetical protein [Streptococcus plurextorum]|uniref:hypothetical protein n=1 Tax=Streptococcus plurextorum TaxID=456876 RepID=UPI000401386D|nr:hypothetical protein [Streptococcus plurextorum]